MGIQSLLNQAKNERKWDISDLRLLRWAKDQLCRASQSCKRRCRSAAGEKHKALVEMANQLHQSNEDRKAVGPKHNSECFDKVISVQIRLLLLSSVRFCMILPGTKE